MRPLSPFLKFGRCWLAGFEALGGTDTLAPLGQVFLLLIFLTCTLGPALGLTHPGIEGAGDAFILSVPLTLVVGIAFVGKQAKEEAQLRAFREAERERAETWEP